MNDIVVGLGFSPSLCHSWTRQPGALSFARSVESHFARELRDGAVVHERVERAVQRAEQLAALLDRDPVVLARGDPPASGP